MGVTLVGDSKPMMPLTASELAERHENQKALYDDVSLFLKQRGSKPLETSMFANAKPVGRTTGRPAGRVTRNYGRNYSGNTAGKPAAQPAGRFVNNQPLKNLKEDGQHYANIANGNKGNAVGPFVATTQGPSKSNTGTVKSNGAPNKIGQRQGWDGLKNSEAVLALAAQINAERAESDAAKMLGENNHTNAVKTLDAPKTLDAHKTITAPQNVVEHKNLPGVKNLNERKGYNGPQDFDDVKEITARIDAPKSLIESRSVNADKSLYGSVHDPKIVGEPMAWSTPNNTSGVNPEARAFVPAACPSASNPGLADNNDWMVHARSFVSGGGLGSIHGGTSTAARERHVKVREAPARVLLFKDVPDWLTLSDAIGFVYGGAIDSIFRSDMAEITVQFCEEAACKAYLEAYPNGIKVANPGNPAEEVTINLEKATRGQEITPPLQVKIGSGGSRLVRVDGMLDAAKIQELTARAMVHDVDHVEFRAEKNKTGSAYFFFCSLADGWSFRQKLKQDEDWADYTAEFMADPCKVATSFHGNTLPNRMASAVAAVAAA